MRALFFYENLPVFELSLTSSFNQRHSISVIVVKEYKSTTKLKLFHRISHMNHDDSHDVQSAMLNIAIATTTLRRGLSGQGLGMNVTGFKVHSKAEVVNENK